MRAFFTSQAQDIAAQIVASYKKMDLPAADEVETEKADFTGVKKAIEDDLQRQIDQALLEINFNGWTVLFDDIQPVLEEIAKYSAARALAQVDITDKDITKMVDEYAVAWSRFRAAQLVGKRIEEGKLVDNPDADWAITESTRTYLRSTVTEAVNEGWSTQMLEKEIMESAAFDKNRANMVARTEIAFADVEGRLIGYKNSGVVTGKMSIMADGHDDDDECDENAAAGVIPIDDAFPSGDSGPPYHPRCECDIIPIVGEEEENGQE